MGRTARAQDGALQCRTQHRARSRTIRTSSATAAHSVLAQLAIVNGARDALEVATPRLKRRCGQPRRTNFGKHAEACPTRNSDDTPTGRMLTPIDSQGVRPINVRNAYGVMIPPPHSSGQRRMARRCRLARRSTSQPRACRRCGWFQRQSALLHPLLATRSHRQEVELSTTHQSQRGERPQTEPTTSLPATAGWHARDRLLEQQTLVENRSEHHVGNSPKRRNANAPDHAPSTRAQE